MKLSSYRLDMPTFTLAVIGAITCVAMAAFFGAPLVLYSIHWWGLR